MELDAQHHPALLAARARAQDILAGLRTALAAAPQGCAPFVTIAACGSLGRLEIGADPDLDAVFVTAADADPEAVRDGVRRVFAEAQRLGLRAPRADGIYVTPVTREALLAEAARGSLLETPAVFGKRFALLLDAQPLGPDASLATLQREVLDWYLRPFPGDLPAEQWDYLVADLVRYANTYRNWQVAKVGDTLHDSHALRRAKLASTRHVTWLGLWLLVLRASANADAGADWLCARLRLSPIARVVTVLGEVDARRARDALDCYERIVAMFRREDARIALLRQNLYSERAEDSAVFDELRAAAADFRAIVMAGVLTGLSGDAPWRVSMAMPF